MALLLQDFNFSLIVEDNGELSLWGVKQATGDIILPEGINKLLYCAFSPTEIKSIVLPNSLNTIDDGVFSNCYKLTSITIPNSVTNIGHDIFSFCENLTEVNWESPINLTKEMIKDIFRGCENLRIINYRGKKINLYDSNLDDLINKKTEFSSDKQDLNLEQIIKDVGEER